MRNILHDSETARSRRSLFKWMKQVAAGTSLAAVGLGLANAKTALANPNCTPCSGCQVVSCQVSGTCRAHDPNTPILVTYQTLSGCVPPGCTMSSNLFECNSSCACFV
jgi:hypothetical protein